MLTDLLIEKWFKIFQVFLSCWRTFSKINDINIKFVVSSLLSSVQLTLIIIIGGLALSFWDNMLNSLTNISHGNIFTTLLNACLLVAQSTQLGQILITLTQSLGVWHFICLDRRLWWTGMAGCSHNEAVCRLYMLSHWHFLMLPTKFRLLLCLIRQANYTTALHI